MYYEDIYHGSSESLVSSARAKLIGPDGEVITNHG